MTLPFDWKAIGYGVGTFVVGYMILGIFTTFVASSHGSALGYAIWTLVKVGATVLPAVAGYVSAYYSRSRHILHRIVGGSLGMALLIGYLAVSFQAYSTHSAWGVSFLVMIFTLIAAVGAIVGSYLRGKLQL